MEKDNFQLKELFDRVRVHGSPNFFGTHIPLNTQLNVEKWEEFLAEYWDKQLLQFLKFCFLLVFNRNCILSHAFLNYKSAMDHPSHVQAYLQEEIAMGAIKGPFEKSPFLVVMFLPSCQGQSPILTLEESLWNSVGLMVNR